MRDTNKKYHNVFSLEAGCLTFQGANLVEILVMLFSWILNKSRSHPVLMTFLLRRRKLTRVMVLFL